jgi:hypothetical protein
MGDGIGERVLCVLSVSPFLCVEGWIVANRGRSVGRDYSAAGAAELRIGRVV